MGDKQSTPQRDCLGTLFHSQYRLNAGKSPVCAGFKGTQTARTGVMTGESVPAGEFKYMCIGYSVFDEEPRRQKGDHASDTTELPYCEGLEIISAAELLKTPAPLHEASAASVSGRDPVQQDPGPRNPARPRPGRSFVPGGEGGMDWDAFGERFLKSSRKVVERMSSNLAFIGRSAKQTIDRLGSWRGDD